MKDFKWLLCSLGFAVLFASCEDNLEGTYTPTVFNFTAASVMTNLSPCEDGEDLDASELSDPIQTYLSTNFPALAISEIEQYEDGSIEIELVNDLHLYFSPEGIFIGDDEEEDNSPELLAELLELAKAYLEANHPGLTQQIEEAELEYYFGEYFLEVEFGKRGEMIFNADGELLCSYDDQDRMDDENGHKIDSDELPQSVLDYIAENYPDAEIEEAELDDDGYEVELDNGVELYFDLDGNLVGTDDDEDEEEGEDDDDIDPTALPQSILDYIAANYPGVEIDEAEVDDDGYEVELDNGVELYFDLDGNLVGTDDDEDDEEGEDDDDIDPTALPQSILDYIAANYPGVEIDEAEVDDDGYEVELDNGVELYFDLDGNLVGTDDDEDSDEDEGSDEDEDKGSDDDDDDLIPVDALPQSILDYIAENYPDATIVKAEKDDDKYEVNLNTGVELYFDLEGNFLGKDDG